MTRLALLVAVLAGQALPSFEAASIKRNVTREARIRFETPPGRLNAVNVPLRFVIRQAYRVPESRIVGGPGWLDSDRFDILATAAGGATADGVREMLRALLKERFALALRMEAREMPAYVLRTARVDGTLGPNLRRATMDCGGRASSIVAGRVQCGVLVSQGSQTASMRGGGATLENVVRLLADFLDRPLIDETGLAGAFDLELEFSTVTSAAPDDVPSVFTAVREQLGLRLDAERRRVDVWGVEGVSPPTLD